ncbi:hypothetical protein OG618_06160 [Kitasatospora sp. NBC_01246]|uniref:hypothetical protein n=1 Tax=Kitasatospora sp. NBC_01246 TaxID=2903570 RepID=UPI002E32B623|nr:hypothetical protein [Kitasatospora sp. NBC_01246]
MTADARRAAAVEAALARLDLTAEAALLSGADLWSLPAGEAVGLGRRTARVSTPPRAVRTRDTAARAWAARPGGSTVSAGRHMAERTLTRALDVD